MKNKHEIDKAETSGTDGDMYTFRVIHIFR